MRVQLSRNDALPLTWEIPAAICACWLLVGALAIPTGLAASTWLAGRGWSWPERPLPDVLSDLLAGELAAGSLSAADYALVMACEALVASIAVTALMVWSCTCGPHAQQGMAGRREVTAVLGARNLRSRRAVIRPDMTTDRRLVGPRE